MSKHQITITLGSSGQKVVKRPWEARNNPQMQSRSKRSLQDDSFLLTSKRPRRNDSVKSSAGSAAGSKIDGGDLRLKLMRKRMSESQQSVEIHGSVTRVVKSVEKSERSSVRNILSSNGERPRMDSLTRAYSSKASDGLRLKSTDAIAKASPPVADVKYVNEIRQVPSSRLTNLSGSRIAASSDVVKPSLSKIPVPVPMRQSLDARKQATAPPVATSTIQRNPQPNARPLTMNSFLHSLGLEKYAIHFQAEEIDMAVLKQMGDRDLKELGLPMTFDEYGSLKLNDAYHKGPRKKILLAMMPPVRRPAA